MMRLVGAAIVLAMVSLPASAAPPQRVMSLKICTDELLMDLVLASRIASLSYLSREPAALKLWPEAADIPVNHNTLEEILAQKPDLVLTLAPAEPGLRAMLTRAGVALLEVPEAEDFSDIRAITRQVGAAVGESVRANELIAAMDEKLVRLAADVPQSIVRVAGWGGSGYMAGRRSLFDAVVTAAGGTSIGEGRYYDVESLIAAWPDLLAGGDDYQNLPSLHAQESDHPVLRKLFADRRAVYSSALVGCGVPETADAALSLHAAIKAAARRPGEAP